MRDSKPIKTPISEHLEREIWKDMKEIRYLLKSENGRKSYELKYRLSCIYRANKLLKELKNMDSNNLQ